MVSVSLKGAIYGFDNSDRIGGTGANFSVDNGFIGIWGVALEFGSISLVEDLPHTFRVIFMEGTSDPGAQCATIEASAMA